MTVTRQRYTVSRRDYLISPEPRLRTSRLAQVLVRALLRDETTGADPRFELTVTTTQANANPKAVDGGLAGISGIPERVFPQLAASAYSFEVTFAGERAVPLRVPITIGPQPAFPDSFAPVDLGVLELHREPVIISGRAARMVGASLQGLAGTTVRLTGLWRQTPPSNIAVPADPPNLLSLAPGAHFDHDTVTGRVRAITLAPVAGDSRTLLEDYAAGGAQMRVSNRTGLGPGVVLEVNAIDPGLTEFLVVQSVAGSADPSLPATVTLLYPGRLTHRLNSMARIVVPGGAGPDNALAVNLIPGDRGVVASAMAGLAGTAAVEIHGGPNPSEYQLVSLFETVTDAGGYFRLPPLCRAGQIELTADNGVDPPIAATVVPSYSGEQQTVNFTWS